MHKQAWITSRIDCGWLCFLIGRTGQEEGRICREDEKQSGSTP